MANRETIFAPATAPGRAGVAVIRVSGPDVVAILAALTGQDKAPSSRKATLTKFFDQDTGEVLDQGLVLLFPAPHSFTGEDVAELHCHGGAAVLSALLSTLGRRADCRLAEAGEFTKRAFQNGKMDLTQAEGLADLIAAETEGQRRQAQRQLAGELGQIYESWRADLIGILAHLEANIDFPDEELPGSISDFGRSLLNRLVGEISFHLDDNHRGERLRDGCHMVILGPPNVGKSSLFNALARRDVAIVAPQAGTTRDVLEVHLNLGGYPVILADTAGIRSSNDTIEAEGVRRAKSRGDQADLRIVLYDCSESDGPNDKTMDLAKDGILIASKPDLAKEAPRLGLAVSSKTGEGLNDLLESLTSEAAKIMSAGGPPSLTRIRHRQELEGCLDALRRALAESEIELIAEEVRFAMRRLGRVTGGVDVEDILDVVFMEFCIGK